MTTTTRANWRTPDATRVDIDLADRIAWLRERRNGIGGTDAAALMGVHVTTTMSTVPDVTAADVFREKLATDEPVEDDKAIYAFGHLLEPRLAANAEAAFGVRTRPGGFYRNKAEPFRYANPDFLTSDGGILECKTTSNRGRGAAAWLRGDVSGHAYMQTQHYLATTGRSHAYYAVAIRNDFSPWEAVPRDLWHTDWFHELAVKDFVEVGPISRDEAVIEQLLDIERRFWAAVQAGDLPDDLQVPVPPAEAYPTAVPDSDVEASVPDMVADDIARLAAIKADMKALKAQADRIEDDLKRQIADREYLRVNGTRVARWRNVAGSTFDKKGLAADHPELVAKYTHANPTRRFELVTIEEKA